MKQKEVADLMGTLVRVTKRLYRAGWTERRDWHARDADGRVGWIVGYRHLLQGKILVAYGSPTEFKEDGSRTPCLMVCFWPNQNAVPVPLDGYELADPGEEPRDDAWHWTDYEKEQHRAEMAGWPRNDKGQWVDATTARALGYFDRAEAEEATS